MSRGGGCPRTLTAAASLDGWDWPSIDVVRHTLANGLRVILAENHTVPLVWMSWVCQAGIERDAPEHSGLAALTPLLLREGTSRRSAGRITEEVDDLGADLVVGCDWDRAFLNIELLSADLDAGVDLLFDMACRPRFPEAAVARLRQRRLGECARRPQQALADDEFARVLYGATTYGRAPLGTVETLQRIEPAQVEAFHASHYRPETACFVMVGSFDSAAALERLSSLELPSGRLSDSRRPPSFTPAAQAEAGVRIVDVPQARQTEIRMGHVGVARDNPDLPALQVLNTMLGGGPSSRLAVSLRQHKGLTYRVRSRFAVRRGAGPFVVETSVAHGAAATAVAGIVDEIQRLREERAPAGELEQAQRRVLGAELRRFQGLAETVGMLSQDALEQAIGQDLDQRRRTIAACEPESLRDLARRYLDPQRLAAVVVGPAEALRSQFSGDAGARACRPVSLESIS